MNDSTHHTRPGKTVLRRALLAAWLTGVVVCAVGEYRRVQAAPAEQPVWLTVISGLSVDTSLFVPLLLVGPLVWRGSGNSSTNEHAEREGARWLPALAVATVASVLALLTSAYVARTTVSGTDHAFGSLPPAYHDEYSYLFQARTFLAGRTVFESPEPPGVFDQMHVLNDGRFASRYFPGTGVWMAPWVAVDQPWLGHRVANALIAGLFAFAAARAAGCVAGLITGVCLALAPGVAVFSNLLLAHHPGLLGLGVFVVCFFESRRSSPFAWNIGAGTGLAFAMLCRPMTAAGFALPFGVWMVERLLRDKPNRDAWRRACLGMAIPLAAGFAVLGAYNFSITGSAVRSPYQIYTDTYTPNHVFGFNNVVRGNAVDAPARIEKYDGWAENLTAGVAVRNVRRRVHASARWTLGVVPTAMLFALVVALWLRLRVEARLAAASVVTLHAAHIPYWFDGIMHYHYVFETSAMWCLLAGLVLTDLFRWLPVGLSSRQGAWVAACLIVAFLIAWAPLPNPFVADATLFGGPLVQQEVNGIAFSRLKYKRFRDHFDQLQKPALVLIEHDPADIHIEYVTNAPTLDGEVLVGHAEPFRRAGNPRHLFPDRSVYVFDARTDSWRSGLPKP